MLRRPLLILGMLVLAWWLAVSLHHGAANPGRDTHSLHETVSTGTDTPLAVQGGPSLDGTRVDGILAAYRSPLAGHGAQLARLSRQYDVDDAVALAFFVMESRAGTQGEAVLTRSFGNLRPMPNVPMKDGYRRYHTWMESADEWFKVIRSLYVQTLKLRTVDAIVPVYAPASDNNSPPTMIAGIHQLVRCWRGYAAACPADPPGVRLLITATQ